DNTMDILSANPNLSDTITSISRTLRPFSSLSFYTDGSLVHATSSEARMGSAFILSEPLDCKIRLAISTTSWPSAYRAELLDCTVNLYSNCESVIKHFEYINNGGFLNIRNIFKQPYHNL